MYTIGYDIGSSSIKAALVETASGKGIAVVSEPKVEMAMIAHKNGWAEQHPDDWWQHVCTATKKLIKANQIDPKTITGIGISYQMHGLVVVDKQGVPLRNSIIWCDSRAVEIGQKAFDALGHDTCAEQLLNSPANFTASKLKWVKENEPEIYKKIHKFMLPGDYIAYRLGNTICTTKSGLSEGIFWDFKSNSLAKWLLDYYGIDQKLVPPIVDNLFFTRKCECQGRLGKWPCCRHPHTISRGRPAKQCPFPKCVQPRGSGRNGRHFRRGLCNYRLPFCKGELEGKQFCPCELRQSKTQNWKIIVHQWRRNPVSLVVEQFERCLL